MPRVLADHVAARSPDWLEELDDTGLLASSPPQEARLELQLDVDLVLARVSEIELEL